jgi:hypothetical protein
MGDRMNIVTSIIALIALYLVGVILSHIKPIKVKIVKKITVKMEKKYQFCQKSGQKKKANALKLLKWILIKADDGTSALIDIIVNISKEKNEDMVESLKSVTRSEIDLKLNKGDSE